MRSFIHFIPTLVQQTHNIAVPAPSLTDTQNTMYSFNKTSKNNTIHSFCITMRSFNSQHNVLISGHWSVQMLKARWPTSPTILTLNNPLEFISILVMLACMTFRRKKRSIGTCRDLEINQHSRWISLITGWRDLLRFRTHFIACFMLTFTALLEYTAITQEWGYIRLLWGYWYVLYYVKLLLRFNLPANAQGYLWIEYTDIHILYIQWQSSNVA